MNFWMRNKSGVTLLFITIWLTACGSDPGFNESTDFINKEGSAQFANMMTDSPEVTVIHGLTQSLVQFPFISPIEIRFEDNYDWRVAYLDSDNREVTVARGDDQTISENTLSTFLLMGNTTQPDVQIVDHLLTTLDNRPTDVAEIWFASNLSATSMVDIYITNFGADLATTSPLTTLNSGSFSEVFDVPAGNDKQLRITVAATMDLLFDSGSIQIPGQSFDLYALVDDFGPEGSNHANVIRSITASGGTITDVSQASHARATNFTTVGSVDVSIGTTTYTGVDTSESTVYQNVPAGTQNIAISNGGEIVFQEDGPLTAGSFQTLLMFDSAEGQTDPVLATLVQDELRQVSDRALFQFVNGSSQAIDFYALRNGETTENVAPTFNDVQNSASGVVEVLLGQTRFVATTTDGASTLDSTDLTLAEGQSYTIVFDSTGTLRTLQN